MKDFKKKEKTMEIKTTIFTILNILIVLTIVVTAITLSVKSYYSGSKDSHYKEVCIRGHVYYRSNFMAKMGLSIALDDNGKPIKCEAIK